MGVNVEHLRFSYDEKVNVLNDITFRAEPGEVLAVLGPNGVGKSTLFQCLLGFLKPSSGTVKLVEQDVQHMTNSERARAIAYIPQSAAPVFNYTVLDIVTMGMTGQLGMFESPGPRHRERAMETLRSLGMGHLADRGCNQISGGERQLMLLARALVQDAKILLMDEPTANLDYGNSYRVMERICTLGNRGFTVIFSSHEPGHALRYADRVLALLGGRVLTEGRPLDVLTEDALSKLYGIPVAVRDVDVAGERYHVSVPYAESSE